MARAEQKPAIASDVVGTIERAGIHEERLDKQLLSRAKREILVGVGGIDVFVGVRVMVGVSVMVGVAVGGLLILNGLTCQADQIPLLPSVRDLIK